MTLSAGTRLGPYEIQAPLGAGGMGENRARDTKLNCEVALKVLPDAFTRDQRHRACSSHLTDSGSGFSADPR